MPSIVESGPLVTRLIISGLRPDTTGAPALDRNEEGETKDRASWPSAQDDVQQSDIRALNGPWILQEPLNRVCKSPGGAQEIEQARCKIELRCTTQSGLLSFHKDVDRQGRDSQGCDPQQNAIRTLQIGYDVELFDSISIDDVLVQRILAVPSDAIDLEVNVQAIIRNAQARNDEGYRDGDETNCAIS